ncbi:hypothetical protein HMJ29_12500 [Hymenobacter taeanensis]|uniref:Lipoprotein n=1 Tax=Hymenobacter taeanensis TaxID=2735321 RepID=A0A6M6BHZ4_9BACT|nr:MULTISPECIES: hypothetical protein [Hymenobacter]QJX47716.1 hypothetical protein HMJ29_12500 [Hymenobacter taeanensis]UOQ82799.1 hypothetical protein MUN83_08570 [Hymenobacter sp. 5414T-23]
MNFANRYLLLLLLASMAITGCKSSEEALYSAVHSNHSVSIGKLPRLEQVVDAGPLYATEGAYPDDAAKVFRQELAYHTAEPEDTLGYGYAKLIITQANVSRTGRALQVFQMATLMTPCLVGLPLEWYRTKVTAEVQIINSKGVVLGTYRGTGHSKVRVAMYNGYSQSSAPRISDVQGLRLALNQIRPQLDTASLNLRTKLVAAGPLEEVTGTAHTTK